MMEELVDDGIAKNIGIRSVCILQVPWLADLFLCSNFQGSLIIDLLRYARIEPSVLQVELHPYLTQENLVRFAKQLGIAITAYSSFGPLSYYELGFNGASSLLEHDAVTSMAKKHSKSKSF